MKQTVYDKQPYGTRITLWVERSETGDLAIAGQDIGAAPLEVFGDSDHEYWYTFDAERERLLASHLAKRLAHVSDAPNGTPATEDLLRRAFRTGLFDTPSDLRPFLEEHGIEYAFSSFA